MGKIFGIYFHKAEEGYMQAYIHIYLCIKALARNKRDHSFLPPQINFTTMQICKILFLLIFHIKCNVS